MLNYNRKIFEANIKSSDSKSIITRYYNGILEASRHITPTTSKTFSPEFSYPTLDEKWEAFFSVAQASLDPLDSYAGRNLYLLDLMKNPGTHTTKTTASLLMVARAVQHINTTGDSILMFTPSSGNKAIALRDAVARALELELVTPDKLRIASLTPVSTLHKIRRNLLTESEELRRLNPILVYPGAEAANVKKIGKAFTELAGNGTTERIWYSLDIANYKVADACRAFYEHEFAEINPSHRRVHAHAVSSAYGLLGYQHGINTMATMGIAHPQPGFLLIQHLATSDMVRHYLHHVTGHEPTPTWIHKTEKGIHEQQQSLHFPQTTWDPEENFEPTFYTHNPPTSSEMTSLIARHGGSGIVVSLLECLQRYGEARHQLNRTTRSLPTDPRQLAEWSLSMGMTGVLNGIDRGLLDGFDEVILHGSGMYLADPEKMPDRAQFTEVSTAEDVVKAVF